MTHLPYPGETNPLTPEQKAAQASATRTVDWTAEGLYITRFRLLSDFDFPAWDVSYCYGRIGTETVRVQLPFSQLPKKCTYVDARTGEKRKGGWRAALIAECNKAGLSAKRLGILDNASTLI